MYPYIHIGSFSIGTFGILLWLAAVCACWVLHANFRRWKIDADAIGIVAISTVVGVIGAKLWHELQNPADFLAELHQVGLPGWHHPLTVAVNFLEWFRAGFAWFGGMVASIAMLMWQGRQIKPERLTGWMGSLWMLDLSAAAAAVGYGVGRLGCLTSGDGDYGINTTLPWGVRMAKDALVLPTPPDARVHPTPIYELIVALFIGWILWRRGSPDSPRPIGQLTGEYLVYTGIARFLVEFIRINPRIYWGMSNAQVASLGSIVAGALLILWARNRGLLPTPQVEAPAEVPVTTQS